MRSKSRHAMALVLAVLSFVPFSGCGGRSERTVPKAEPLEACDSEQCALAWDGCCPPCGGADPSRYRAVSRSRRAEHQARTCPLPQPCPACSEPFPPIVAACTAQGCELLDLAQDPSIACMVDAECRVRTKDCECGGDTSAAGLIAVSDGTRYEALVCAESGGCLDCLPTYESAPKPRCEGGRCTLRR
jgi:hypothetical protein